MQSICIVMEPKSVLDKEVFFSKRVDVYLSSIDRTKQAFKYCFVQFAAVALLWITAVLFQQYIHNFHKHL